MLYGLCRLVDPGGEEACFAVLDQLGHGAPIEGYDRRSTHHGFSNAQSEGLVERDGMQQGIGMAEQPVTLSGSGIARIYHTIAVNERAYMFVKLGFILY